MKTYIDYGKQLLKEMKKDRATGLAAEQSYYYVLSIFPILILLLSILPYLSIEPIKAINFIRDVLPPDTATLIEENVMEIVTSPNGGLLTFGIIGTIWSASNGVQAFIHSMNVAFDMKETRSFIKIRLLSIVLTIGLLIAFIIALLLPVFGNVILDFISSYISIPSEFKMLFSLLRWVVAIVIISFVLAFLYHLAPNKHYPYKHVFPGAVVATLLWLAISLGFSFYVSNFGSYSDTYGSIGGVIVLMIWLYLTGLALVIGGEINAIYHRTIMSTSKPTGQDRSLNA
ncbi:YihY/virulence factor BrkB family protein [Bacillus sp. 2205SS5-2]|uniref:YihY/virulence factor BrkB family protein n=1 Tax=Bacillus sp. 2205SS5-2 TaxID=3109031 RepID=UPI0030052392